MEAQGATSSSASASPTVASESFARFVYPFAAHGACAGRMVERLETATWNETRLWEPDRINDDRDLKDLIRQFRRDSVSRWRLSPVALRDWLGFDDRAWVLQARGKSTIEWMLTGVQFWWFEDHVGFLTFEAAPVASDPDAWLAFLHYFRFTGGSQQRRIWPRDGQMPQWMAETLGRGRPDQTTAWALVSALLAPVGLVRGDPASWQTLADAWLMFPFAGMFVDDLPAGEQPLLRHRFRLSFRADQGQNAAQEDLETRDHPCFLPYADQQWFTYSMNGGGFLAFDAPDNHFNLTALPDHLRTRYWFVLLLVLHQRYALTLFSRQTTEYWEDRIADTGQPNAEETAETFEQMERLYRGLLTFTAHGYFTQLVQLDHYHRFYRRWVEVLQIQPLYDEVRDEIAEMRAWLDLVLTRQNAEREKAEAAAAQRRAEEDARIAQATEQQAQRLERRLNHFALLLGVPALLLTAVAVTGQRSWWAVVLWSVAGVLIGWVILQKLNRPDTAPDKIPPEPIPPDTQPPGD